jgi:hypothetical protein
MRFLLENWAQRVWAERDAAAIDEMCMPGCSIYSSGPEPLVGPEQYRQFHGQVCDLLVQTRLVVNHCIEQDGWMAALCTFTGRTADGREASMTGSIQARIVDGKVEEAYNHFDFVDFFAQLGLLPANTLECCMSGRAVGNG